jgi:predicted RNase H-like nuclease (RuvC/YqgF family)
MRGHGGNMAEDEVVEALETPAVETLASDATELPAEADTGQKTSESAPEAPASDKKPTDNPPEKPEKSSRALERRIDRLHKAAAEQKARADLLERQLEELKPKPEVKGGLKIEDFDYDYEKYAEARAKQAEKSAVELYEANRRSNEETQSTKRLLTEWESKVEKASDKYDDFDEVVGELNPRSPIIKAIMQADNGEDVAYYLATHFEEAKKIAALDQVSAIRAIGKLEAKLLATPRKPETPSRAPEPIAPLNGKSSVSSDEPSDNDDMETWIRKRSKQVRG